MTDSISAALARRMTLAAQGFARPAASTATPAGTRQLNGTFQRMGTLQIDSVNVFSRSHYMPFFSRLGPYDTTSLDRLLFAPKPTYVESWAHVAAFIPATDWGLFAFRMDDMRARYGTASDTWFIENQEIVQWVRDELAARGPLRPAQIDHDAKASRRGQWWDWDVIKRALEYLWLFGEVAIAGRRGFERRYALAEQVIPEAALAPIERSTAIRQLVERAARAYGVSTAADIADYWRLRSRSEVIEAVRELEDEGTLIPVTVDGWLRGDNPIPTWIHQDAVRPRQMNIATVLTPFDPVVWFRDRAKRQFGFDYKIEIYTPAAQRTYGYYSLPILIGDNLVGRIDLKADRAASTLLVQSAWWQDGADTDAERLAAVVVDAARWQQLESISISSWGNATGDLAAVLANAKRHNAGG